MATKRFNPIRGKRLRVTRLDECGNVPEAAAADSLVVTKGFVTVSLSADVEDGEEIIRRRADGSICVNERTNPSFKNFGVEVEFCDVDPDLLALVTNAEAYEDYNSDAAGIVVPEGEISKRFALELWTGLTGAVCAPGEEASGYLLLPFVAAGTIGDLTVGSGDATSFTMTGAVTMGQNKWGTGPYAVIGNAMEAASALPTALDPLDHLLLLNTTIAPPADAVGLQVMPARPS